jgi:hypothetical protein
MLSCMVEVFKTNVQQTQQAEELIFLLRQKFPESKINFDLDDCDKVLRIEGNDFVSGNVMQVLIKRGFMCNLLE